MQFRLVECRVGKTSSSTSQDNTNSHREEVAGLGYDNSSNAFCAAMVSPIICMEQAMESDNEGSGAYPRPIQEYIIIVYV